MQTKTRERKNQAQHVEAIGEVEYLVAYGQRLQIRRLPADRPDDVLLNKAAICADFDIRTVTFDKRQREFGWPGIRGEKLGGEQHPVVDTVGREKDEMFFRRDDVKRARGTADVSAAKDHRVLHDGAWRCKKSWAIKQIGIGGGKLFRDWCEAHGVEFEQLAITSRMTGWRRAQWCVESVFLDAKRRWEKSHSGGPPTINGGPSMSALELCREIRDRRGKQSSDWNTLKGWIENGCRYLDGAKLRAKRAKVRSHNKACYWYVDKGQAERILMAIIAESKWKPKRGYESEEQIAERLGYKTMRERFRLYCALRLCREEKLLDVERSPLVGRAYFYLVNDESAEALRMAVDRFRRQWVQPQRQSGWKAGQRVMFLAAIRTSWKAEKTRNDEFFQKRQEGWKPKEIRDWWNEAHPDAKVSIDTVKTGIKPGKKRNGASAVASN